MKLRTGFVSNSSSSSFVIIGRYLNGDIGNVRELRDKGLKYYEADEDGPCVGLPLDIQDNETWGEYKDRVAKILTVNGIPTEAKDVRLCTGTYMC